MRGYLLFCLFLALGFISCTHEHNETSQVDDLYYPADSIPEDIVYVDSLMSADGKLKIYQWKYEDNGTTPWMETVAIYHNQKGQVFVDHRNLFHVAMGEDILLSTPIDMVFVCTEDTVTIYLLQFNAMQSSFYGNSVVAAYRIGTDMLEPDSIFRVNDEVYNYVIREVEL